MNLQLFATVIVKVFMTISVSILVSEIEAFQRLAVKTTQKKFVSVYPKSWRFMH